MDDIVTATNLARWWDEWKVGLRRALLTDLRTIRQSMTNSYRTKLRRLQVNNHVTAVGNSTAERLLLFSATRWLTVVETGNGGSVNNFNDNTRTALELLPADFLRECRRNLETTL